MTNTEITNQPELICDMPGSIRPHSRLANIGPEALSESELLTIVLRSRSLRKAEALFAKYTLRDLLTMPHRKLARMKELGVTGATTLLAAAELIRRHDGQTPIGLPKVHTVQDVLMHAIDIRDRKKEYLLALFLNARKQLIANETISIGTLTASLAHPRLCCLCSYVVFIV